jgi:hypothetical protein
MTRSVDARVADVRRLLDAARAVHAGRAHIAPGIARTTGLTPEGVELGFESLERDASDEDLRKLVAGVGRVHRVHVILSANVFVAPFRAIAMARAAADRVTVRPSPRDPVLTRALVEAAGDEAIAVIDERDVASLDVDEIHAYGRDATIAAVRGRARRGTVVRGHGPGLGVAIVTGASDLDSAAEGLAADVVAFDQRGCLSPRIALVEGDPARGESFARALHERLGKWAARIRRGVLSEEERADARRWLDAATFAGSVWRGDQDAVAIAPPGTPLAIPPSGRHVDVVTERGLGAIAARMAPIVSFVVAVGSDDPARVSAIAPPWSRVSALGEMQRPPLDGPVDRRAP